LCFDLCFDLTFLRYTKAVDAVRKQQKVQSAEFSKMKLELENFSLLHSELMQIEEKIQEKSQKFKDRKETEEKFKGIIEVLDQKNATLSTSLGEKQQVQTKISSLRKTIDSKEEECTRFCSTLTERYEGLNMISN
jgi:uncharacterized coiled-coil DUF342 family protein